MPFRPRLFAACVVLTLAGLGWFPAPAHAQLGIALSGVGPIDRSMGGAATAAPLDSLGALYWNPATISGLHNEVEFGSELLYAQSRLSSTVPAGALGPLFGPPVTVSGSDRGDNGPSLLPSIGLVYHPQDSDVTFGLGVYAAGGFSVNYPASLTNPILMPQPPNGFGLGNLAAQFIDIQIAPTMSLQVTDHLSVGFAPTANLADLTADPALLASPNFVKVLGVPLPNYEAATNTRWTWGLGCQAGAYYTTDAGWNVGASVKSPQWFEPFRFNAANLMGQPTVIKFHFDYPMMASIGFSYTGFERWVLATDFRYVDYHDTPGFSHSGFDATGAASGLGFDSIFCVALGAQYKLTDALSLRCGYTYNMNPIPDAHSIFNVASPTIIEHAVYMGASYQVTSCFLLSMAYAHGFENSVSGPIISPLGTFSGTSVSSTVSADTVVLGATVKF